MAQTTSLLPKEHGAYVSYKPTYAGEEPYEITSTWWSRPVKISPLSDSSCRGSP